MPSEKAPLFVRLPKRQIAALERLASETGRPKQRVVSELLAGRLPGASIGVGRVEVAPALTADEVLTLDEAAALLKVTPQTVQRLAEAAEVPVRNVGGEWRFSRAALLTWLVGDRAERGDR